MQLATSRNTLHILNTTNLKLNETCSVCNKKVRNQIKGLSCLSCNHIIHKKCSHLSCKDLKEIHSNIKYWECIICQNNKFPFSNVEDDELTKSSFNLYYNCQCGHKKANYTPDNDL